ncbi:gamma-glutamyl-gamma-aminobutyrate hydrolase family protein [Microvirga guangxiensis]|uniref:gamma-glutamyl-gamma-aminobutyrate hydrolase n=1 Tax=Microvirga guangxiensis TaxID=549386 RepID=A0A1G5JR51_9HYPH|nr:gamma-glutamyl-gamma-aminobutyrate hydrolase family protein [Microvirga guangxiensis]SCY90179.1 gamma-glutamyl-gamma-aminobutyrate hydrolase [Microvirga guangxiensis]
MTASKTSRPIVGILGNRIYDGLLPTQAVDEKYLHAAIELADVDVVIIPSLENLSGMENILDRLDGVLLTGAATNVHPKYFDPEADQDSYKPFDAGRDDAALKLIRSVCDRDIPLLAICRGIQEINVAFGGSLYANIATDDEHHCHTTWVSGAPLEQLYGPAHDLLVTPGGSLETLTRQEPFKVNSLHVQAIERLGEGLTVEARAPDGAIEAISVQGCTFSMGVQWHPEFQASENELSRSLFSAFGSAVRAYSQKRAAR